MAPQGRQELIAFGRGLVTERLEALGCTVEAPNGNRGALAVMTPSGRSLDVLVSTQRVGGYAYWEQARLDLSDDRVAAIVLLADDDDPRVYLVPTTDFADPHPEAPLVNREHANTRSAPEYGILLSRAQLPALARYGWDAHARAVFG